MSALNGDKSRHRRQRKATLLRRTRSRLALAAMKAQTVRAQGGPAGSAASEPAAARRPGRSFRAKTETT